MSASDELCYLTISQAANLIQQRKLSPVGLTEAHLARIERLDGELGCFITVAADAARAIGASGGARNRGRSPPRSAARDSYRPQGQPGNRGSAHDGRLPRSCRLGSASGCRECGPPARCRNRAPRQAHAQRVCLRLRRSRGGIVPGSTEPLEHAARAGRFQQWIGGVTCGGSLHGLARRRHRGIHPRSGRQLQRGRPETDLRSGQPRGRLPGGLVAGPHRPHDADSARQRSAAPGTHRQWHSRRCQNAGRD